MTKDPTITARHQPGLIVGPLTGIAREGARQMLMAALKAEAARLVARFGKELLPDGRQRGAGRHRDLRGQCTAKYPRGVTFPTKDTEAFLTSSDFPAQQWDQLRTSNPIESRRARARTSGV